MSAVDSPDDPKAHRIAGLVQLGFYFCCGSCKYTKYTGHRRTVQFRPLLDFVFFVRTTPSPPTDDLIEHFQYTIQIVLTLDNQENAIQGKTIYHFRSESLAACPVQAGNMGAQTPPWPATILKPARDSAPSAPRTSLQWARPDLGFP